MSRGYCGQCGGLYSDQMPCECQGRTRTSDREFSDPTIYDISIDSDDAADGSDGGYDRKGNYVIPSAMQEIVHLRAEVKQLRQFQSMSEEDPLKFQNYRRTDAENFAVVLKSFLYFDCIDFSQSPPYFRYDTDTDCTPDEKWHLFLSIQDDFKDYECELVDICIEHDCISGYVNPLYITLPTREYDRVIKECREAIASLPEDAFGFGGDVGMCDDGEIVDTRYPIRDEILRDIDKLFMHCNYQKKKENSNGK